MTLKNLPVTAGLLAGSALAITLATSSFAADHAEAPEATLNPPADIADYYAWHEGTQLNLIVTFGPASAPGTPAAFNSNILYTLHFDTDADNVSDVEIYARFAQDSAGDWGVQVTGADTAVVSGAVDTVLTQGDTSVWAGLTDDPFFFDQTGFRETVATGVLAFDNTRNDFAGLNVTSIVVALPVTSIIGDGTTFQTWATTSTL